MKTEIDLNTVIYPDFERFETDGLKNSFLSNRDSFHLYETR